MRRKKTEKQRSPVKRADKLYWIVSSDPPSRWLGDRVNTLLPMIRADSIREACSVPTQKIPANPRKQIEAARPMPRRFRMDRKV
jgi:hypothetical protein